MDFKYFKCDVENINENDIKRQFKKLAKKYHPDCNSDEETQQINSRKMQEINEEHKEILVLLKYNILNKPRENPYNDYVSPKSKSKTVIKDAINLIALKPDQQRELIDKGRDFLNYLYSSITNNLVEKVEK